MYVECSLRGDPKKGRLIYELNFKSCMRVKRKTKASSLLVLHKEKFNIYPEYSDANNIFSHKFIQNLKHKPNIVQGLSRQMKKSLKNR